LCQAVDCIFEYYHLASNTSLVFLMIALDLMETIEQSLSQAFIFELVPRVESE
jgi:hypothetical protein